MANAPHTDAIIRFAKLNENLPHWKIHSGFDGSKGTLCGSTEPFLSNGEISRELSGTKLKETLEFLTPGDYSIGFKDKKDQNNGIIWHKFTVGYLRPDSIAAPIQQQPYQYSKDFIPVEQVQQIVQTQLSVFKAEMEKQKLQEEILQLKKQLRVKDNGGVITQIGKHIGTTAIMELINRFAPAGNMNVGMTGLNANMIPANKPSDANAQDNENEDEDTPIRWDEIHNSSVERLYKTIAGDKWGQPDAAIDGIKVLYGLGRWLEENPDMFNMYIVPAISQYVKELDNAV